MVQSFRLPIEEQESFSPFSGRRLQSLAVNIAIVISRFAKGFKKRCYFAPAFRTIADSTEVMATAPLSFCKRGLDRS